MTISKRIIFGLIATLILGITGCIAILNHLDASMCETTVIDQVTSPNKTLKAVLFQRDCGATTGFNSQVVIVASNKDISQKNALPESFFIADTGRDSAPAGKGGGPEIRLNWQSETQLQIQHHEFARLFKAETSSKSVAVNYKTFR